MNKALVTGGAGFIGSHIVDELVSRGVETYVIDDLSSGSVDNLSLSIRSGLLHFINGDVKDIEALMPDMSDIDAVFHEAAYVSVPQSILNPQIAYKSNVDNTFKLITHCMDSGVKKFVFASSAAVYDGVSDPISVETSCRPTSPYGASKAAIETYLWAYWKTYGFKSVALRYFNVYGPRQRFSADSGVVTIFTDKIMSGQRPTIFGDGTQTRDFVNVGDIVRANILAAESASSAGEIFNVGTGISTSLNDLVGMLNRISGNNLSPIFEEGRIGDSLFSLASIEKAGRVLGYEPEIGLEQGLMKMLRGRSN